MEVLRSKGKYCKYLIKCGFFSACFANIIFKNESGGNKNCSFKEALWGHYLSFICAGHNYSTQQSFMSSQLSDQFHANYFP